MVIVFLVCSIVTFIVMLGIIVIHERIIVNSRLPFKRLRLKVKGVASIAIRRSVLTGIIVVVFSLLAGGLVFVAVSRTMPVQHYLYRWQETVTSDIVANGLLGVIFGGLFAAWLSRTYRKPADEKLTFIQKIEAVTLLLLFVIGTTSVSREPPHRAFPEDRPLRSNAHSVHQHPKTPIGRASITPRKSMRRLNQIPHQKARFFEVSAWLRCSRKSQIVLASGTLSPNPRPRNRMKERRSWIWNSAWSSERS